MIHTQGCPHSQPLAESRNASKTTSASREEYCWSSFSTTLPPVETILGESQGSGRRIGLSHVLRKGDFSPKEKRGTKGVTGWPALILDRGLFCAHSAQDYRNLFWTPFLNAAARSSDWFLASVAVPAHLRRVPSHRLLTSGTSVVLEPSGLSPPEDQVAQ